MFIFFWLDGFFMLISLVGKVIANATVELMRIKRRCNFYNWKKRRWFTNVVGICAKWQNKVTRQMWVAAFVGDALVDLQLLEKSFRKSKLCVVLATDLLITPDVWTWTRRNAWVRILAGGFFSFKAEKTKACVYVCLFVPTYVS